MLQGTLTGFLLNRGSFFVSIHWASDKIDVKKNLIRFYSSLPEVRFHYVSAIDHAYLDWFGSITISYILRSGQSWFYQLILVRPASLSYLGSENIGNVLTLAWKESPVIPVLAIAA